MSTKNMLHLRKRLLKTTSISPFLRTKFSFTSILRKKFLGLDKYLNEISVHYTRRLYDRDRMVLFIFQKNEAINMYKNLMTL